METAKHVGYPLSVLGLIFSCPPLEHWLTPTFGMAGRFGGMVTFAIGWALLFAYLVFRLGMESQRSEED